MVDHADFWWMEAESLRNRHFRLSLNEPEDQWTIPISTIVSIGQDSSEHVGSAILGHTPDCVLDLVSILSSALSSLADFTVGANERPRSTQSDIERCSRYLANPFLRYLTGRGANDTVLDAWSAYLTEREFALQRMESDWQAILRPRVQVLLDCLREESVGNRQISDGIDVLESDIIAPLLLLDGQRERTQVIPELRSRLASLERQCERASREMGVMGTLVSLALVPVSDALGWWFLLPILITTLTYLIGFRVTGALHSLRRASDNVVSNVQAAQWTQGRGFIEALLPSDRETVLVLGDRLAPAEIGAAIQFAHTLRVHRRRRCFLVTHAVGLTCSNDAVLIFLGGPLIRDTSDPRSSLPAVDMTRIDGQWWLAGMAASSPTPIALAAANERMGCLARGSAEDFYLFGSRELGVVSVMQTLCLWLEDPKECFDWLDEHKYKLVLYPDHGNEALAAVWVSTSRRLARRR